MATSEIRVGDNDRLAARVAQMASADLLILLSDVDGFYTADPEKHDNAEHIPLVSTITDEMRAMASPSRTPTGTGGMVTKLDAAVIAAAAGCHTAIALGTVDHPLEHLREGGKHTLFTAADNPRNARKEWLAGSLCPKGRLLVDEGAVRALEKGGSLLPAGVTKVEGNFGKGDAVEIITPSGKRLARGLCAYDAREAACIAGKNSGDIESTLGYRGREVLIHRDDMVML